MLKIIENSIIYKFLCNSFEFFGLVYENSIVNKFLTKLGIIIKNSIFGRFCNQVIESDTTIHTTLYAKLILNFQKIVQMLNSPLTNSLVYKLSQKFISSFVNIGKYSFFTKYFVGLGFKKCILLALALYLPIDYFLRSILVIPVLSSAWDEILLVVGFATIIYRVCLKKIDLSKKISALDPYVILYFIVGILLILLVSPKLAIAIAGYRVVFQYILCFFITICLIDDYSDFKLIFNTLIGIIIFIGLHGIYQYIIAVEMPSHWMTNTEEAVRTRVFSILDSPNIMGAILVLLSPMIASIAYSTKNTVTRCIAIALTACMCLSVLFTFSKGAWVGMVVAVAIFALLIDKRLLGLGMTGIIAVFAVFPSVVNRITYLFTADYKYASSIGGRTMRWQYGLDILSRDTVNEFLGFGLGRFGGAAAMQNQVSEYLTYFYLDNYYLKTLVEMGYLGLGTYILLLLAFAILGLKAIINLRNTKYYIPCVGMYAGMFGVLTHCYFENIFEVPYMTAYFWTMCAMILACSTLAKKEKTTK